MKTKKGFTPHHFCHGLFLCIKKLKKRLGLINQSDEECGAGFTLVELMIVIAVIGVLAAALGGGAYMNSRKRARDAQRMSEVEQARADLEMIRADEGAYPVSVTFDNCDTCSYSGGGACYTITATLDCSVDGRDCSSPPYTYSRSCP